MKHKKHFIITLFLMTFPAFLFAQTYKVDRIRIGGHIGERIQTCIEERVKKENVNELIEAFRHKDETSRWQSEFFGKWMLGAIGLYHYSYDPELLALIQTSAEQFMQTQTPEGYIGNYAPEAQLTNWDIWGRKYSALALIAYYKLTHNEKALHAVERLTDHLMLQLKRQHIDISKTGLYRGMASCSILEPVVYLYELTRNKQYMDFAMHIVQCMEQEGSSQLITKTLQNIPVSQRTPHPATWWSYENGQKAYEMMSCYEGLMELGRVLDDPLYCQVAQRTAENIRNEEINIAGSGAAFECWYKGKELQTQPAYHTMETCVTFTYMQFCNRLARETDNPIYIDEFERTMYNALLAAMKDDGSQISKYSPLEGHRVTGEEQCGMHINCCNANGPRAFALIPQMAFTTKEKQCMLNLYLPMDVTVTTGKRNHIRFNVATNYPISGKINVTVCPERKEQFTLAFRMPSYVNEAKAWINGKEIEVLHNGGYLYINKEWTKNDVVTLDLSIATKVVSLNNMQAITHGPLVFARDSRFEDGDIDECAVIQRNDMDIVNAEIQEHENFAWLTLRVPMILGTDLENAENKEIKYIRFCDFSSAGNNWSPSGRYRVWIPQTLHIMSEPYKKY